MPKMSDVAVYAKRAQRRWARWLHPACSIAFGVAAAAACSRETPSGRQAPDKSASVSMSARGDAPGAVTSSQAAVTSAAAVTSSAPSLPAPARASGQCKALGQTGNAALGVLRDERLRLGVERGDVFVLGYTHAQARVQLLRVARAGGELEKIAEHSSLGEPSDPVIRDGAAYFTQKGKLVRLGPGSGASATVQVEADSPVAVQGDQAFYVDCDRAGSSDRLMITALSGGEPKALAELAHTPGKRCQYASLVADAREVLVADWNSFRIVAVDRTHGSVRDVVRKRGFPQDLMLETETLSFLSAKGLERVARTGTKAPTLIYSHGVSAPFSDAQLHGGQYWLHAHLTYTEGMQLSRLPYPGEKAQTIATFKITDPTANTEGDHSLEAYTLDDQCVYWAHRRYGQPAELVARAL